MDRNDKQRVGVERGLLSRAEAAAYLGVAIQTLANWQSTKRYPLPAIKIGRRVKYRRCDLDEFIEANRVVDSREAL